MFGFVFSFAENCFPNSITINLPKEIAESKFNFWYSGEWRLKDYSSKQKTKETFKSFIKLVDDDALFEVFKNDKSFNSYSAMIKAVYLDSYKDEISKEEINDLVEGIQKDIEDYKNGQYLSVREDTMRITMLAPLHFAFADYAIKKATKEIDDYSSFKNAYEEIVKLNKDKIGRAIVASWVKMYELGAMQRSGASDELVRKAVTELDTLGENNPQLNTVITGYLAYGLTEHGKWLALRQDLFTLAKSSKELALFLDGLGLKGY